MDIYDSIGERLRAERERLGRSQSEVAEVVAAAGVPGATRQSQSLYEKGKRMPDAAYLAVVAGIGVDVAFVLTGQRGVSPNHSRANDLPDRAPTSNASHATHLPPPNRAPAHDLTPEHGALIDNYEHCSPADQAAIRQIAATAAQPHVTKRPRKAG